MPQAVICFSQFHQREDQKDHSKYLIDQEKAQMPLLAKIPQSPKLRRLQDPGCESLRIQVKIRWLYKFFGHHGLPDSFEEHT